MIVPEYMRFYAQTPDQVFNEFAITFFTLAGAMYRIMANETLSDILAVSTGMAGKDGSGVVDRLKEQAKGSHGILEEVRTVKGLKK